MIIKENRELKIMKFLSRFWYRDFSAYEIAKETKISAPTIYKVIKKFEEKELIKDGKRVKINFNNLFSYSFKLTYDAERLFELKKEDRNKTNRVYNTFKAEYGIDLLAFIIFGSAASNEQTSQSDIDFLIIVNKKKEIDYRKKGILSMGNLNIIEKTQGEFENEYLLANDLVLNALMNGIIIFDNGIIRFLLNKPLPAPSYEVINDKKERLEILKGRLLALLKDKNYKELTEQLKLFIIEKARVLFLEKGIIPSSKKFIIKNLKNISKQLYNDYNNLSEKNVKEILQKNV